MEPTILCQDGRNVLMRDSDGNYFEIVLDHSDEIEGLEALLDSFMDWFGMPGNSYMHSIMPEFTWDSYLRDISPWSYSLGPHRSNNGHL